MDDAALIDKEALRGAHKSVRRFRGGSERSVGAAGAPTRSCEFWRKAWRRVHRLLWPVGSTGSAAARSLVASAPHGLLHWDIAPGWSRLRYLWMLTCVRAKFGQNQDLAALVSTDSNRLVESGSVDNEVNRIPPAAGITANSAPKQLNLD